MAQAPGPCHLIRFLRSPAAESRHAGLAVGAKVAGAVGWQEYVRLDGAAVDIIADDDLLTANLGPLGGTGLTAYFGLLRIGRPEPGDTMFRSGSTYQVKGDYKVGELYI